MLNQFSGALILALILSATQCNDRENGDDIFVPTKNWKVVRKGQKIPQGLHVRINLETGLTEAKLLNRNEAGEDKSRALTPVSEVSFKNKVDLDDIKIIKDSFRSYDEIKKSLEQFNLTPKSDAEVIADLLKEHEKVLYSENINNAEVLNIIEDLDLLAHQYDNAHEFVNKNGFHKIIYKNLNNTKSAIRKATLKLMGSLMQNNILPKIHALETGAIGVLLRLIKFDSNIAVKISGVTALGALLRLFPAAQQNFIDNGGLTVLAKFFNENEIKIRIKVVTLITDLVIEHNSAISDEKLSKYYDKLNIATSLLAHDWCQNLNKLLLDLLITDKDDHDSVEKCLMAIHSLKVHCGSTVEGNVLKTLHKRYEVLASSDSDSSYFVNMKKVCADILSHVSAPKTEL